MQAVAQGEAAAGAQGVGGRFGGGGLAEADGPAGEDL